MVENISKELLEILVCPKTREKLEFDEVNSRLIARKAGLFYEIEEGIPILLSKKAKKL